MICAACGGVASFDFARCPACGAPTGGVESEDDDTPMRPAPPRDITRKVPEAIVRNLARGEKASGSARHSETRRVPREILEQLARSEPGQEGASATDPDEGDAWGGDESSEPDEELELRPPPPGDADANPFDALDESLTLPFEPSAPVPVPPHGERDDDRGDSLPIETRDAPTEEDSPFDDAPSEPLPRVESAAPPAAPPQRRGLAAPPPLPPQVQAAGSSRPPPPAPSPPPAPAPEPVAEPIVPQVDRAGRPPDAPRPVRAAVPAVAPLQSVPKVPLSMQLGAVPLVLPPAVRSTSSRRRLVLTAAGLAAVAAGGMALLWAVWLGRTATVALGTSGASRPPSSPPPTLSPAPPGTKPSGLAPAAAVPAVPEGPCPSGALLFQPPHASRREAYCIDAYEYPGRGQLPHADVTRDQAAALCAARDERLCTPREWETACRGPGDTSYPYGDSFRPQRCNTALRDGSDPRPLAAAGAYPTCRSPSGAFDMSGNAAEWDAAGGVRGGSSRVGGHAVRCSQRDVPPPGGSAAWIGFRCCADPAFRTRAGGE